MEKEYVYEVGLTPDDKARIQRFLGVRTLSLEAYENAKSVIDEIEIQDNTL